MLPDLTVDHWMDASSVALGSQHLLELAGELEPGFLDRVRWETISVVSSLPGLRVVSDYTMRSKSCPIDGTYDPSTQTIVYRPMSENRDRFTLLHELGHHLLALDPRWSFDIGPLLDKRPTGGRVEERIVNEFASRVLIPDEDSSVAFGHGVTAQAVANLYDNVSASATACLVRALAEPGDRLVMLTNMEGRPWFADSHGSPFSPGTRTQQPTLERAAHRASESTDESYSGIGLGPIRYASGKTFSEVRYDVAIRGGLVFAVITALMRDVRVTPDSPEWGLDCLRGCGQFTREESLGECRKCGEARCPRCRACECSVSKPKVCSKCYTELPSARSTTELCDQCE